jgi:hypothetical protein
MITTEDEAWMRFFSIRSNLNTPRKAGGVEVGGEN